MGLLYVFNEIMPSGFSSSYNENGQGRGMTEALGNSTLSAARN